MKPNSLATKLPVAIICLVVLVYFGLQGYSYYHNPLTTTTAYSYEEASSIGVSGWVVRREQVLQDNTSGLLRLSCGEGEKVAKGGRIAVVYSDQTSLDRRRQMDELQTRISQLEYAQEAAGSGETALRMDSQILRQLLALRTDVSADELADAEAHTAELRSLVLKRDFTYAGGDVEAELKDLKAQLTALGSQSAGTTRTVTAPVSGVYSAVVDGYESVLTPEGLENITPSALTEVTAGETGSQLGRLITGDDWYYAATMSAASAQSLSVGQTVTLRFVKGAGRDLTMKVQSISAEENGRVAVVLTSRQYLSEVTLLRRQSADIILSTVQGIRIPSAALRVADDGQTGVYCVVGMTARFKPVTVVYTDQGYVLVRAADESGGKGVLRPGDQVIITANDLYDGKIVE